MEHHIESWVRCYLGDPRPLVFLLADDAAIVVSGDRDLVLWVVTHKDGEYTAKMDRAAANSDNHGVMCRVFEILDSHRSGHLTPKL